MPPSIADFTSGLIAMTFIVACVFFLRFWRRTRDELFLAFALAFFLLALNQALTSVLGQLFEEQSWIYLLRLAAFFVLILAILRKHIGR